MYKKLSKNQYENSKACKLYVQVHNAQKHGTQYKPLMINIIIVLAFSVQNSFTFKYLGVFGTTNNDIDAKQNKTKQNKMCRLSQIEVKYNQCMY